jgi:hypothetical protein
MVAQIEGLPPVMANTGAIKEEEKYIYTKSGKPFKTRFTAEQQIDRLLKEGLKTEVVEIGDNAFVLKEIGWVEKPVEKEDEAKKKTSHIYKDRDYSKKFWMVKLNPKSRPEDQDEVPVNEGGKTIRILRNIWIPLKDDAYNTLRECKETIYSKHNLSTHGVAEVNRVEERYPHSAYQISKEEYMELRPQITGNGSERNPNRIVGPERDENGDIFWKVVNEKELR